LRIRNLFAFLVCNVALLVAMATLLGFAQISELRQDFFTYRKKLHFLGSAPSFSPFSIIPTLLSMIISWWWSSIDSMCRALQPYLSMSHQPRKPSQGIGLTYVSSFWLWASVKAGKNQHWLLVLITFTTFLLQIRKPHVIVRFRQRRLTIEQR
jgi:hypothetical protein